jgi:mercuric ion transport protein
MARDVHVGTLGIGAVLTAIGASACCVLPLVMGFLGAGSVALAAKLEPYRPLFIGLTVAFLGLGFYQAYRKPKCTPGEACAVPANRRRQRIILWVVAVLSALALGFPYYAVYLF